MPNAKPGHRPPAWSDEAICRLIWDIRQEHGACSLGQLASAINMNRSAVQMRMRTLRKRGLVVWSPSVAGSIRTTDETTYRAPKP